ncbi:MAG TPA: ABC transporter permease [Galbitalea sp.]
MSDSIIDKLTSNAERRTYANYDRPAWRRILLNQETFVILLLVVVWIVASTTLNNFGTATTVDFLLFDVAPILMIAVPEALVIITGEIDLSVGSIVGLSSAAVGMAVHAHWGFVAAMILAIVVGLVCGLINGVLVTVLGLPSLAVTIGTLALFRGIAVGLLGSTAYTTFPEYWTNLAQGNIAPGFPTVMPLVLLLIIVFAVLLHFTPFGRGIFAIGLSKDAATFSGIRVGRTKLLVFLFTGFVSGIAGIYWTLQYGTAVSSNAVGLELQVIAAVLLGGVSVFGGKGAVPGIIAGVLLIGVLQSALSLAGVTSDGISVITGALLVAAVISTTILAWAHRRRPVSRARTTGVDSRTRD